MSFPNHGNPRPAPIMMPGNVSTPKAIAPLALSALVQEVIDAKVGQGVARVALGAATDAWDAANARHEEAEWELSKRIAMEAGVRAGRAE